MNLMNMKKISLKREVASCWINAIEFCEFLKSPLPKGVGLFNIGIDDVNRLV